MLLFFHKGLVTRVSCYQDICFQDISENILSFFACSILRDGERPAAVTLRGALQDLLRRKEAGRAGENGSGFGFHVDDLLAIIVATVLADTVGKLHLLAARALDDSRRGQLPVRTAHTAAGLRNFSLRTSHCLHLLILVQQRC